MMVASYAQRAVEIIQNEGPIELSKKSIKFILRQFGSHYNRFKFLTWINHLRNCIHYDAPPRPYKIITIRPSEIQHQVGINRTLDENKRPLKKAKKGGAGIARTIGGDWDKPAHRVYVEKNPKIKGIIEFFEQGYKWEDTKLYKNYINKGYDPCLINEWCNNIEELYNDIKQNGYNVGHKGRHHRRNKTQPIRDQLEVLTVIDRNGEIGLFEGNHRFAIARVLDLEIPAQVVCRHTQWQELRDEIYNNGLSQKYEKLCDHPDLQDVIVD